jgi:hypothetical protein
MEPTKKQERLQRCGFCGNYFRGIRELSEEEVDKLTEDELKNIPIGYCPNASNEAEEIEYTPNI